MLRHDAQKESAREGGAGHKAAQARHQLHDGGDQGAGGEASEAVHPVSGRGRPMLDAFAPTRPR